MVYSIKSAFYFIIYALVLTVSDSVVLILPSLDINSSGGCYTVVGRRCRTRGLNISFCSPRPVILQPLACPNPKPNLNTNFGYIWSNMAWSTMTFLSPALQRNPIQLAMTQLHRKETSDTADVSRVEVSEKLIHKYAQLQRFSLNICSLRTRRQRTKRRMFKPILLKMGKVFLSSAACKHFSSSQFL